MQHRYVCFKCKFTQVSVFHHGSKISFHWLQKIKTLVPSRVFHCVRLTENEHQQKDALYVWVMTLTVVWIWLLFTNTNLGVHARVCTDGSAPVPPSGKPASITKLFFFFKKEKKTSCFFQNAFWQSLLLLFPRQCNENNEVHCCCLRFQFQLWCTWKTRRDLSAVSRSSSVRTHECCYIYFS